VKEGRGAHCSGFGVENHWGGRQETPETAAEHESPSSPLASGVEAGQGGDDGTDASLDPLALQYWPSA